MILPAELLLRASLNNLVDATIIYILVIDVIHDTFQKILHKSCCGFKHNRTAMEQDELKVLRMIRDQACIETCEAFSRLVYRSDLSSSSPRTQHHISKRNNANYEYTFNDNAPQTESNIKMVNQHTKDCLPCHLVHLLYYLCSLVHIDQS